MFFFCPQDKEGNPEDEIHTLNVAMNNKTPIAYP